MNRTSVSRAIGALGATIRTDARVAKRAAARAAITEPARAAHPGLLPLGALACGFGLFQADALAQTPPAAPAPAASSASAPQGVTLQAIPVRGRTETDQNSVRATTTTAGRGNQDVRDVPQSLTVVTEKLLDDRKTDTVKEALHFTAGISFLAAEGGEEDIRLRGFSLTASGDIYADNVRDPAFYERDVFNFDRLEVLRGSASMLFGRGSSGGIVNQVSKMPLLTTVSEITSTIGSGDYTRFTGDFNVKTGETSALRLNAMKTDADNWGNGIDKYGVAPTFRWGIGTNDEFSLGYYYLENRNGIHYGMPWLRRDSTAPISAANPGVLVPVDAKNYYGARSDYSDGYASYGTFRYTKRFGDGGLWNTTLRHGGYDRDQRASTIRFCVRGATTNLDCVAEQPTLATVNDATTLTRGTNNKVQDLTATYLQTDYSNTFNWFGRPNQILAGVDLARETFNNYTLSLPAGVTLNKNSPRVTLGNPDDGTWVDESLRVRTLNRNFVAKALGIYAQNLVEVVPTVKLLAGVRWDRFEGRFVSPATATVAEQVRERSDSLWSYRAGAIWQPRENLSFYVSYGTSFNTSGELYNYDAQGSNTPPEKNENLEAGAKMTFFDGDLSVGLAVFRTTKYNERNRDSPEGVPLEYYLLSGKRHANGLDVDIAGRITPKWLFYASYEWIPSANIDKVQGATLSGELEGQRPSLTPRHSGSLFTTYQVLEKLRLGAGINARGAQTPNRNPAGIVAPHYVTYDAFAEYAFNDQMSVRLNVNNLTDKLYADSLYSGHYIPGAPRTVYGTFSARF